MKRILSSLVICCPFVFVDVVFVDAIAADISIDLWGIGQSGDLGNVSSDGSGGRQILIRPLELEDVGQQWKFFPPHDQLPEYYPEPTPATPAQELVFLPAGAPLVLVLPQLQHYPSGADVAVSHSVDGNQIVAEASIHFLGYITNTIYGPHEYVHPLGSFAPGEYRLTLNLTMSDVFAPTSSRLTGYVDFVVQPVPEPSTVAMVFLYVGPVVVASSRGRRRSAGRYSRHGGCPVQKRR